MQELQRLYICINLIVVPAMLYKLMELVYEFEILGVYLSLLVYFGYC